MAFCARRHHSASRNAAHHETPRQLPTRILLTSERSLALNFYLNFRQDFGAIGGDRYGVFEMRGRFSIGGDDRPAIVKDSHLVGPKIDHWLNGKDETRLDLRTFTIVNVIENGRIFVQRPADTVSAELTDDPVVVRIGKSLNRG